LELPFDSLVELSVVLDSKLSGEGFFELSSDAFVEPSVDLEA